MGDRRQVIFNNKLWFYTHWGGSSLPHLLKHAISSAKGRWGDDSYCLRIIVSKLSEPNLNSETGSGLWFSNMDSEYNNFEVDITGRTVKLGIEQWTFEEFVGLPEEHLNRMSE